MENEWLIMKGQKQKYYQYLAHAASLMTIPDFMEKVLVLVINTSRRKLDTYLHIRIIHQSKELGALNHG